MVYQSRKKYKSKRERLTTSLKRWKLVFIFALILCLFSCKKEPAPLNCDNVSEIVNTKETSVEKLAEFLDRTLPKDYLSFLFEVEKFKKDELK
jgi:hypothetical protein